MFGKCSESANYLFCRSCGKRHVAVAIGEDKFLGVDESGECCEVYEISGDDLQLYAFKRHIFFNDLQRNAFDLMEEKIEEIVPDTCWRIGTFLMKFGIYFIHGAQPIGMEDAIHRAIVAVRREGRMFYFPKKQLRRFLVLAVQLSGEW
ncbi:MAG: hypothetical protein LBI61_01280 [Puniceicoccales bacterium]|jgi:hypothetical protein|nr:hypothetical protein [Puniceicoccales bacterium]